MNQITEDYVSYEIAVLLKEKGFDIPCRSAYIWNSGYELCASFSKPLHFNREGELEDYADDSVPRISAPTHQMAIKWLREVHHIFIEINVSMDLNGNYHHNYSILDKECKYIRRFVGYYSTHELCVEEALKYTIGNL